MKKLNKKGQEEMVGFVLIVILVSVVFLVFLGIFVNKNKVAVQSESVEIYQFLESIMEYTTDCAISYEPDYSNIKELILECYSGSICLSEKQACAVLNETLSEILSASWLVGEERDQKGYIFKADYSTNLTNAEIIRIDNGQCTNSTSVRGSEYIYPAYPGNIKSSLKICY